MKTARKAQNIKVNSSQDLIIALLIVFFLLLLHYMDALSVFTQRIPKKNLVNAYGVDKKTFNKWLKLFFPDLVPILVNKRKLDIITVLLAIYELGLPGFPPDGIGVMSKGDIVKKGEGNYRSLRESINLPPRDWPIPADAFNQLSIFPPSISKVLLEVYG